jgi:phosphatidylethanolamine-binding protein (PEBP) family uncharacterized protein
LEVEEGLEWSFVAIPEITELVEYKPPGPPPKTGKHRYVMLLLQGENEHLKAPDDRKHWGFEGSGRRGAAKWIKREGLSVVGGTFWYEENEEQ